MHSRHAAAPFLAVSLLFGISSRTAGQGSPADYARSAQLNARFEGLAVDVPDRAAWIGQTDDFWYRRTVRGGGYQFMLVDARTLEKRPAFDHTRLAAAIDLTTGEHHTGTTLPFSEISFSDELAAVRFTADGYDWSCALSTYTCTRTQPAAGARGRGRTPSRDEENPDATPFEGPWADDNLNVDDGTAPVQQVTGQLAEDDSTRRSPDGTHEAYIDNYNVYVRAAGSHQGTTMTFDGSEGAAYDLRSIVWSPDSRKLAVYRVTPGYRRVVRYVISSPADQVQPKYMERVYAKPGDVLEVREPVLIDVEQAHAVHVDPAMFPNAYQLSRFEWRKDSHAFTFEYNQRGHQAYRVIEVDAERGTPRVVIDEETPTFFDYRPASGNITDSGKKFRYDVADGKEVIWMSERDGWNHLYLYDGATGRVKNQITKGPWAVRAVQHVDEARRQIYFSASGMNPKEDPYFTHYYRINFDGTGLIPFTTGGRKPHRRVVAGQHVLPRHLVPRRPGAGARSCIASTDQRIVMHVEHGDISALEAAGWRAPDVFVAKGRDGKTDIWGIIFRPTTFDPTKSYPVIENIYAGPQGSFVPKSFAVNNAMQKLAELGFIVVQIDGMGTSNRSKAFHDVAWKNLGDAGFPDRILWHKAVAAKYPWYDISARGHLRHIGRRPECAGRHAVPSGVLQGRRVRAGCHDNRMDKIWWNEQWMGWPIGPQYAASSNAVQREQSAG